MTDAETELIAEQVADRLENKIIRILEKHYVSEAKCVTNMTILKEKYYWPFAIKVAGISGLIATISNIAVFVLTKNFYK